MRGTLAALDEAAHGQLGYGKRPDAALSLADMQPFLRRRYEADVRARLTRSQADDLEKIVQQVRTETFSVKDAAAAWKKERSRAARSLAELCKTGYGSLHTGFYQGLQANPAFAPYLSIISIEQRAATEERGRPAAFYTVSGAALLAFGSD